MELSRNFRVALMAAIGILATMPAAIGQSLATFEPEVVSAVGLPVPGIPGMSFNLGTMTTPPVIQDDGRVLFHAKVFGAGTVSNVSDRVLFYGEKGALVKVLQWGDPEPTGTIPGATIVEILDNYALSPNGTIVFGARVAGPGVSFANDAVLYAGTPGNLSIIAREGSAAPNSPVGTIHAPNADHFGQTSPSFGANAAGHVHFTTTLSGPISGLAAFAGPSNSPTRIMNVGEVVGPNLTVFSIPTVTQMNDAGQVLLDRVTYQPVVIGNQSIVGPENDTAVWLYTPGSGKQEILREGAASPITGAKFADVINAGATIKSNFNALGQCLLRCGLTNAAMSTAITFGVNDVILILASTNGHTIVARKGDPAPGIPSAVFALTSGDITMRLNDNGVVAFAAPIAGPGITAANNSALYVGTPGNLTLVARKGSVAPGTNGMTFGDLFTSYLNNADQVVFHNVISSGSSFVNTLWSWDAAAGLQLLATSNDQIEVAPGNFQFLGSPFVDGQSNAGSRSRCFADDGTFAFRTGFGVLTVRIGSLTGLPRRISAAAGGTQSLYLNAKPVHAGEIYIVAGTLSGTSPGTAVGTFLVPINLDFYTNIILSNENLPPFGNTLGILDSAGRSVATISVAPGIPGIAGIVFHHIYATLNTSGALTFVSEPAALTIVP